MGRSPKPRLSRARVLLEEAARQRNVFSRGPDVTPGPFSKSSAPTLIPVTPSEISAALQEHRRGGRKLYVQLFGRPRLYTPLDRKVTAIRRSAKHSLSKMTKELQRHRSMVLRMEKRVGKMPRSTIDEVQALIPNLWKFYEARSVLAKTELARSMTESRLLSTIQALTDKPSKKLQAVLHEVEEWKRKKAVAERYLTEIETLGPDIKMYRKYFMESARWRKQFEILLKKVESAKAKSLVPPSLLQKFIVAAFNYYNRSVQRLTRELVIFRKSGILFEGRSPKKILAELHMSQNNVKRYQKLISD